MTWNGRDEALPCRTIEEFKSYLRSLNFNSGWRPSGMVVHNTASPTLHQWWHGGTTPEQRMVNLRNYYENDMGWSSGPHAFVDGVTWWIFVDFNVKGVHSPSWNGTRLGIELVGDYASESDETGMGAKVMEMAVALFGECHEFFGWEPSNEKIKLHKEDPATDHDCPGRNIVKSEFIADVQAYMGSGGGDTDEPLEPAQGTVYNLVAGDKLNIRSEPSSSSSIIGTAENDDAVTVIGDAWNGSTHWLRLQTSAGEGVPEIGGWASAEYIRIEGDIPQGEDWRTSIEATEFGGGGDDQDSAYGDIDWINSSSRGVALPYKWKEVPRPLIEVQGPSGAVITEVIDLGPWNTHNPEYVLQGFRPLVETQYANQTPAQNGMIPTNKAAIDLTPPIANEIGINGKGQVKWRFAEEGALMSQAPKKVHKRAVAHNTSNKKNRRA